MKLCDIEKDTLMEWLAKEPTEVVALAYVYAKGINMYGIDVTKTWETAVQNTIALDKAYERGRADESNAWLARLREGAEE